MVRRGLPRFLSRGFCPSSRQTGSNARGRTPPHSLYHARVNTLLPRLRRNLLCHAALLAALPAVSPASAQTAPPPPASAASISLESLLAEMTDRDRLCRFPSPLYESLQASSYNRESTRRDAPGWFADGDGTGFIREEVIDGRREWVLMEHQGPGCLTRIWTPFFYYDLNNHTGPDVRIYLDGSSTPVINESLISLVTGKGRSPPRWRASPPAQGISISRSPSPPRARSR